MKNHVRVFVHEDLQQGDILSLGRDDSHYLAVVMRLKQEQMLEVFNGRHGLWLAQISNLSKKATELTLLEQILPQTQHDYRIQLNFAPLKKSAMDMLIQKSVEMGVSILQPTITERTNKENIKMERLQLQIKEACEQCERLDIPTLLEPIKLPQLCADIPADHKVFYGDETCGGTPAIQAFTAQKGHHDYHILIGAEGGFSPSEFALFQQSSYIPMSLGPRILRAETAAIAALCAFQMSLGDWSQPLRRSI